jgi:hypothetical protein
MEESLDYGCFCDININEPIHLDGEQQITA